MSESLWRRSRRLWAHTVQDDVDDEVSFHVQMRVDQFLAAGMSRDEAERAARERFGNVSEVRSALVGIGARVRRNRDWRERFDGVRQDIVVSIRALRRDPLFTAGVVLTLGLGIGANATMFGVIDRLMLRGPDGVTDARQIDRLYITTNEGTNGTKTRSSAGYVTYATLRDRATSFAGVGAYSSGATIVYGAGTNAREIALSRATWDLFPALGAKPALGRFYDATEDHPPRGDEVVVLGYEFWQSELGGDASILGKRITLGDRPYTVVGVASPGFTGPERVRADVWLPMTLVAPRPDWPTTYQAQWLRIVARLKPGVSPARAGVEATTLLRAAYTGGDAFMHQLVATVRPLWFAGNGQPLPVVNVSRWLMGVAVAVLLITCANAANLLIARTRRRRREIAVRLALGVGRRGLLRLLLTETMIVTLGGGVAALVIAGAGSRLMRATLLSSVAWSGSSIDARLFAFTLGVAIVVGLSVGLAPALAATRLSLTRSLKTGSGDGGGRRGAARTVLSVVQAALSVVLLIGAALFVQSLLRVRGADLGFQPARVLRAEPRFVRGLLDGKDWKVVQAQAYADALGRLQSLPWVEHAAIAVGSPYGNGFQVAVRTPARDSLQDLAQGGPYVSAVTAEYFDALGIRVRQGRPFTPADRAGTTPVAIVGETMAAAVWPGENPLGKCLMIGDVKAGAPPRPCANVVGVVADVHLSSVREPATLQYYIPLGQEQGFGGSVLVVRPRGPMPQALADLNRAMAGIPSFSRTRIETIQQSIDPEFRPWQLGAAMFGVFGILALIIAAVGLYSVIAYLVAERTRELGVRIALGATSGRVVRDVVASGVATTAAGVAAGMLIAIAASRFVQPLLFGVSARSPFVLGGVGAVVLSVAVMASWAPARRASRVDPVIALRAD